MNASIKLIISICLVVTCLHLHGEETLNIENDAQFETPVSVAVMPFLSSALDPESDLTAIALRDGVIHHLVNDPTTRVVTRRRAYTLSLDAEIIIADKDSLAPQASADFVVYGHLVPTKTGAQKKVDMVVALFEVATNELVLLERIPAATDRPAILSEKFYNLLRSELHKSVTTAHPESPTPYYGAPNRIAILPIWILGVDDTTADSTIEQLAEAVEQGIRVSWPASDVVNTGEVLKILEDNGLNQIGGRTDAYAANVARVVGADRILIAHLNAVYSDEASDHWSLGLVAIDVETGIVTRVYEQRFSSLSDLLENAALVAEAFSSSTSDQPLIHETLEHRQQQLNAEGQLYYRFATEKNWTSEEAYDLDTELRIEMAESALATTPHLNDELFLNLLSKAFEFAYEKPRGLDPYGDYHRPPLPSIIINNNADFMHLALNRSGRNGVSPRIHDFVEVSTRETQQALFSLSD